MAKRITQETFDQVVKENMETFDMAMEEAIKDAVTQFESQGVDLSNIVKTGATGGDGSHPVLAVLDKIKEEEVSSEEIKASLSDLLKHFEDDAVKALAGTKNGFPVVLGACARFSGKKDAADTELFHLSLEVLAVFLKGQPDLITPPNPDSVEAVVADNPTVKQLIKHMRENKDDARVQETVIRAVRHGCTLHETNRQTFVSEGLIDVLLDCVVTHKTAAPTVAEATRCLRTLVQDDDVRVAFGKGHEHAKLMVSEHGALGKLLGALETFKEDADTLTEINTTLSKLAVRSEFCQEIVDLGGLRLVLGALQSRGDDANVAQACLTVLRAIAGNDDVKKAIVASGGITLILTAMQTHLKRPKVLEQGCAALAALALRDSDNCTAIATEGGPHVLVKCMIMHPDKPKLIGTACRAIRNLVARNHELRPLVLEEAAEQYINEALRKYPEIKDDCKGALRDLGCQVELREHWTGAPRNTQREIHEDS